MNFSYRAGHLLCIAACFALGLLGAAPIQEAYALSCAEPTWTLENPNLQRFSGDENGDVPSVPEEVTLRGSFDGSSYEMIWDDIFVYLEETP